MEIRIRMAEEKLKLGDLVMINLPLNDEAWITEGVREWDNHEAYVSKITPCYQHYTYELDGVVSKAGMPYTWMRYVLVKLKEY